MKGELLKASVQWLIDTRLPCGHVVHPDVRQKLWVGLHYNSFPVMRQ